MKETLDLLVAIIMRFEGCRLVAYRDIGGVWTIGYGETLGVHEGLVWTPDEAKYRLRQRVGQFMLATLKKCPQLHLEPPGRLIGCTSLAYNIGVGAFGASSVSRLTKRCEFERAARSFLLWNKVNGKPIKGLTIRRQAESKRYLS